MDCRKTNEVQYVGDLPLDSMTTLPEYFLAVRKVTDTATGNEKNTLVRVASGTLFPQGTMDNVTALEPNNTAIAIPDNQVRAVYIENAGSAYIMRYADTTHAPVTLAIGKLNSLILTQNCGVINIPEGHSYIIGAQYYVGANGEPTTTVSDYKLFIPVSSTKLAVKL